MILDVSTLAETTRPETDICIVGGGVAGIILAREFIGKSVRVCVLESGGGKRQPSPDNTPAGVDDRRLPYSAQKVPNARRFGGSAHFWDVPIGGHRLGARLRPLDPIDFEKRDWVPYSGWPFRKSDLNPFYDRAQAICRVEPASFAIDDWEDIQTPRLPLPEDNVQTIIYKFIARDTVAKEYTEAVSRADNITTFLRANVLEIETNASADRVERIHVATLDGKRITVTAKLFILACGGMEIPRLLLVSNRTSPKGVGNEYDLVGRFFMEHLHFWQGVFVPAKPAALKATALYNNVHIVKGVAVIGKLALAESVLRRERLLNQNVQLVPQRMPDPFKSRETSRAGVESFKTLCSAVLRGEKLSDDRQHFRNISVSLPQIAIAGARKVRNRLFGGSEILTYYFANMMEQVPNPESRVILSPDRDFFGQPSAQLNWQVARQDFRSAVRSQDIIGCALEKAGLGHFYRETCEDQMPAVVEGGYHYMGTTRMHTDPGQGVVNADCRLHNVQNLFIAGPSVFPTGGYANPVLTIVALTIRLADHLKALLAERYELTVSSLGRD